MRRLKSAILAIFQKGLGWPFPVSAALKNASQLEFEKFLLFWVPMNIQKDWKAKLESAYSLMLKYSKITVRAFSSDMCGKFIQIFIFISFFLGLDKKIKSLSKSVQKDPSKSEVYKSLFSSHHTAVNKPKGNWVTFDPRYN